MRAAAICIHAASKTEARIERISSTRSRQSMLAALNKSNHKWLGCGNRFKCLACGLNAKHYNAKALATTSCVAVGAQFFPRTPAGIRPALLSPEESLFFAQTSAKRYHCSHRFGSFRGVDFCLNCGAYSAWRVQLLRSECSGHPKHAGKLAICALRIGCLPPGLKHWPIDPLADQMLETVTDDELQDEFV